MGSSATSLILEYILAFSIRYWLFSSEFKTTISDRVEISTPVNSWKRVTEGVVLQESGINPYGGDMFHETPIGLIVYSQLIKHAYHYLPLIFIAVDLLTAHCLYMTAKGYMKQVIKRQDSEMSAYCKDATELLLTEADVQHQPLYVVTAYLFNPYILFNTVGQTTTVINNFLLSLAFLSMVKGSRFGVCVSLALATFQALYPIVLIAPACICIGYHSMSSKQTFHDKKSPLCNKILPKALRSPNSDQWIISMAFTIFLFILMLTALLFLSAHISQGWDFIYSVYGFMLMVPDLRPNIGLFWYFFTEMFEHFRLLYLWAFQMNALVLYLVPLSLRTRKDPLLLAACLTSITSMFKSYPCLGDVGFYLSLVPMWAYIFPYLQHGFVVLAAFVITSVLGPTVWHLWIYARSANANFYFGVTLAFAISQIFLVTDILLSYTKREFILRNGLARMANGKHTKLVLQ